LKVNQFYVATLGAMIFSSATVCAQTSPAAAATPNAAPPAPVVSAPIKTVQPQAIELDPNSPFKSRKDAISYAIGVTTARNLGKDGVEYDPAIIIKGMQDATAGTRLQMTEREIRSVMSGLVGEMRQKMASNRKDAEEINKKKGEEYRAGFAKQAGVTTLPNGVMYKVVKAGTGAKPADTDEVTVNYRGTLTNGKEFDGNAEGKPVNLRVAALIAGWKSALKIMPVGSRWTIVIPPALAYGQRGVGADIGPNETLVFDVELVGIK
jgi:FKBP-type peptidyl-prolyl cis-trans isomerase